MPSAAGVPAGMRTSDLRRWHLAVCAVFAVSGMGVSTWLSRIPDVRSDLHLSIFAMGLLSLGLSVGSVAGFTVAGRVAGRITPKAAMFAALATAAGGSAVCALGVATGSQAVVALGLAVLGFGTGVCNVAMNVDAVAIERARERPVLPWFHAMFSIGGVIGAGVGAAAAAVRFPVPAHLLAEAIFSVAVAAWVVSGVPEPSSALRAHADPPTVLPAGGKPATARSGWRDRRTLLIGVLVLGMSFANGAANDWIALAMVSGHHSTTTLAAVTFWVFVMATTTTRLVGTAVLARWGRVRVMRFTAALAAVGIALFICAPSPALAVVGAVLWGLGSALGFPIGMSAAGDDARAAARNIGVVATIGFAASLTGPPLLGLTGDHLGLLPALVAPLVFVVAAGAIAGVVRPLAPLRRRSDRLADDQATASS